MTKRLYYTDCYLLTFDATITASNQCQDRWHTRLDRSAFYPTSGGQLHDAGKLNDVAVIDVIESDNGDVVHISDSPVGKAGDLIEGEVDPLRRRRNRQKHTAQHIFSRAAVDLYDFATLSVHLGEEYAAVELDAPTLSNEQLRCLEEASNEIIRDNQPVTILQVDADKAAQLPLRRKPARSGSLRIIKIGEREYSACGGTHCSCTAEVGLFKIIGVEKIRKHVLVKFICGDRASDDYRTRFKVTDQLSRQFTCNASDLPDKIRLLSAEHKQLRAEVTRTLSDQLPEQADKLASLVFVCGTRQIVAAQVDSRFNKLLHKLASEVASRIGGIALLAADERLVLATSKTTGLHAGNLARDLADRFELKGGGSATAAQLGGANSAKLNQYRDALIEMATNV